MSGTVIIGFAMVHLLAWIIQIWLNQSLGGMNLNEVSSTLAYGTPLGGIMEAASNSSNINNPLDLGAFLVNFLYTAIKGFISLAFFEYDWINGGGQITDLVVTIIRLVMAAIFFGILAKIIFTTIASFLG